MRVVFDTNTVVSALLWGGIPRKAIELAAAEQIVILSSESLLNELARVLARPKFQPKFAAIGRSPAEVMAEYTASVETVTPADIPPGAVRDPKDQVLLGCAVGGKTNIIVSGDKDLLVLSTYGDIRILSADQFLQYLSSE